MVDRRVKVILDGDVGPYTRALLGAAATTKAFTKELDTSTDRATMLTQSLLAVGPALVPIGATAIPAVAGLSNQFAFAAAGAGVAALAFAGVGDALKAVNEYGLDPSAENLEKMNEALAQIGPQGREFVQFLQSVRPKLEELQNTAQAGLLPGVQEGMTDLLDLLPQAERLVGTIASTLGDLVAEAGDNLNDPRWVEFFEFLNTEARPTLLAMGRTLGNFAEGFANLWMAFSPLSNQFSQSFLELARDFAEWTDGLDQTEGFQEFLAYIEENGPRAWDALTAIGNALLQIVEAAAPVGAVALPIIEAVADAISALADSSIGPALIGTVAAVSALSRALSLMERANAGALGKIFDRAGLSGTVGKIKDVAAATTDLRIAQEKQAAAAIKARDAQLALVPTAQRRAALRDFTTATNELTVAEQAYSTTLRERRAQYARVAGGAALLGVSMTGLDEKLGLSNATMGATIGLLAGPWGAAIGGGIGLAKDFAASNDDVWQAVERANAALHDQSQSLEQQSAAVDAARKKYEEYRDRESGTFNPFSNSLGDLLAHEKNVFEEAFGKSDVDEAKDALEDLEAQQEKNRRAARDHQLAEAGLSGALQSASQATRDQTQANLANITSLNKAANAALIARGGLRGYEAAIDAATESLKQNGRTHDINTEKGRNNQAALDQIAASWNNLTEDQQNATGAAKRAREAFIAAAVGMGYSRTAAKKLADQLLEIPTDLAIDVRIRDRTKAAIADIKRQLANLGRGVNVPINAGVFGLNKADGGYITGPGGPRDDLIPARLSNGEFVINAAATARHRSLLEAINSQRYAGGGFVQPTGAAFPTPSASALSATLTIDYDRLAAAVASLPPSKLSIGRREFATVVQDAQNDIARGNR